LTGTILACRAEPNAQGDLIAFIAPNGSVEVTGETVDGWTPVRCNGQDGWVMADVLAVPDYPVTGTIVTIGGLSANCRFQPTTESLVIARFPNGTEIDILGPTTADGWVPVACVGEEGWIFNNLIMLPPAPDDEPETDPEPES
jgi:SH3-like domain-containing protein